MQNLLPVLIVGAGPTGLSIAVELKRHDIPFRIIDKDIKPTSTSNALVLQTRTLEMWDDIGLLNSALKQGVIIQELDVYSTKKLLGQLKTRVLDSLHPYLLGLAQSETEQLMQNFLTAQNVNLEFQTALTGLHEINDTIEVYLEDKEGKKETLLVNWLIACDGSHSTIRHLINMPFEGRELTQHFVMGDVKLKSDLAPNCANVFFGSNGTAIILPYSKHRTRIVFEVSNDPTFEDEKNPSENKLKKLLAQRTEHPMQIEKTFWISRFWIHEKLVSNYRHHQIFFAGDSAHIHSPAGGQGMNTGMQDAYNLGWKLANVINGKVNPDILNSYNEERRPVAKSVLSRSTFLTRLSTFSNPLILKLRNCIMPFILKGGLAKKFIEINSQLAINYRTSPLTKECNKNASGPRAGDRMLDCWLDNTKTNRLLNYVKGTRPTLLFFSGILRGSKSTYLVEFQEKIYENFGDIFNYVLVSATKIETAPFISVVEDFEQHLHRKYQVMIPTIYFMRPDKYIGFRGRMSDLEELDNYLKQIFKFRKII